MLLGERHGVCCLNLLLLGRQIALVPGKSHDEAALISRRILLHLVDPVLYGLECVLIRQIVADDCAHGVPIVHVNHGAEPFMTTCVPDVHLHLLLSCSRIITIGNRNALLQVGASDCHIVDLVESILAEPHRDGGLADATVSE